MLWDLVEREGSPGDFLGTSLSPQIWRKHIVHHFIKKKQLKCTFVPDAFTCADKEDYRDADDAVRELDGT